MTPEQVTEELLTAVKDNIYVTWNEEDESIKKMIAKNAVYLQTSGGNAGCAPRERFHHW